MIFRLDSVTEADASTDPNVPFVFAPELTIPFMLTQLTCSYIEMKFYNFWIFSSLSYNLLCLETSIIFLSHQIRSVIH